MNGAVTQPNVSLPAIIKFNAAHDGLLEISFCQSTNKGWLFGWSEFNGTSNTN